MMFSHPPKTNPIRTQFVGGSLLKMITDLKHLRFWGAKVSMLSWPAVRMLSTYSGQPLRNTVCSSFRLPAKTAYLLRVTNHQRRATNKNMQNEPNLQNTQINVTPFPTSNYGKFSRLQQPKNEPNSHPTYARNKPNLWKNELKTNLIKPVCPP